MAVQAWKRNSSRLTPVQGACAQAIACLGSKSIPRRDQVAESNSDAASHKYCG